MPAAAVTASDNNEAQWLSVAAAREEILGAVEPVQGHETVALRAGFEPVPACDVVAPFNVPAHANSAMDGYAVRAADLQPGAPTRLTVVGAAMAGGAFSGLASPGQAARVMTGAVLARGTDTVVMQEIVRRQGSAIEIPAGQQTGQNVRRAGEDLAHEAVAPARGRRLSAAEIAPLVSLGIAEVSVGEADYVRALMAQMGSLRSRRIRIKPGRPMACGRIGSAWLFGLPGVPVAVMVTFCQFVADALPRLSGEDPLQPFDGLW